MTWHLHTSVKQTTGVILSVMLAICAQWVLAASNIPSWFMAPPADSPQYLYGLGEGQSRDHAVKLALADIGGKLGTSLKSDLRISKTLRDDKEGLSMQEDIDASVKKMEYSNFEVESAAEQAGKMYVLVRLDRGAMAAKLKSEIEQSRQHLRDDYEQYKQYSSLKKSQVTSELKKKMDKLRLDAVVTKGLVPAYDPLPVLDEVRQMEQVFGKNRDALEVLVERDTNTEVFAQKLEELLTQQGLKVVSTGSRSGKTVIHVKGTKEDKQFDETEYWTKLLVNIQVFDERGKILKTYALNEQGASMSGFSTALAQANVKLYNQFVAKNLMSDLGFN